MLQFKLFIEKSETPESATKETLSRVPKHHRDLLHGYKIAYEDGCTLKKFPDSVGFVSLSNKEKKLHLAAPWRYGRETVLLHELGHLVFEKYMTKPLIDQWQKIVNKTKDKAKQNANELFAHAYSATYSERPVSIHNHPEWVKFIKNLPKEPARKE